MDLADYHELQDLTARLMDAAERFEGPEPRRQALQRLLLRVTGKAADENPGLTLVGLEEEVRAFEDEAPDWYEDEDEDDDMTVRTREEWVEHFRDERRRLREQDDLLTARWKRLREKEDQVSLREQALGQRERQLALALSNVETQRQQVALSLEGLERERQAVALSHEDAVVHDRIEAFAEFRRLLGFALEETRSLPEALEAVGLAVASGGLAPAGVS